MVIRRRGEIKNCDERQVTQEIKDTSLDHLITPNNVEHKSKEDSKNNVCIFIHFLRPNKIVINLNNFSDL